jgi:hypothetical protein
MSFNIHADAYLNESLINEDLSSKVLELNKDLDLEGKGKNESSSKLPLSLQAF